MTLFSASRGADRHWREPMSTLTKLSLAAGVAVFAAPGVSVRYERAKQVTVRAAVYDAAPDETHGIPQGLRSGSISTAPAFRHALPKIRHERTGGV